MPALPLEPSMILLIVSFWLSGLWILSLIFTAETMDHLEQTNMFMFITLGVPPPSYSGRQSRRRVPQ